MKAARTQLRQNFQSYRELISQWVKMAVLYSTKKFVFHFMKAVSRFLQSFPVAGLDGKLWGMMESWQDIVSRLPTKLATFPNSDRYEVVVRGSNCLSCHWKRPCCVCGVQREEKGLLEMGMTSCLTWMNWVCEIRCLFLDMIYLVGDNGTETSFANEDKDFWGDAEFVSPSRISCNVYAIYQYMFS